MPGNDKTTMDKDNKEVVLNEEKCYQKHLLVEKHARTTRKGHMKNSNVLRATALTSPGAIGRKKSSRKI